MCKQFVPAGKVYIEAQAPPSKLRAKLQETGWNKDWLTCENPKCGSKTLAGSSGPGGVCLAINTRAAGAIFVVPHNYFFGATGPFRRPIFVAR
jgi:hypothetical protein